MLPLNATFDTAHSAKNWDNEEKQVKTKAKILQKKRRSFGCTLCTYHIIDLLATHWIKLLCMLEPCLTVTQIWYRPMSTRFSSTYARLNDGSSCSMIAWWNRLFEDRRKSKVVLCSALKEYESISVSPIYTMPASSLTDWRDSSTVKYMAFSSIPYFPLTIFPTFQLFSCLISVSNLTGNLFQSFFAWRLGKSWKATKSNEKPEFFFAKTLMYRSTRFMPALYYCPLCLSISAIFASRNNLVCVNLRARSRVMVWVSHATHVLDTNMYKLAIYFRRVPSIDVFSLPYGLLIHQK